MIADEQVVTGEAVALDLRPAGAGSRGIAALIDLAVIGAVLLVLVFVVALIGSSANEDTVEALLIVVYVGVTVGYPVGMETLWRGRTLGKAAMGLRVVRDDGGPIRFRHALVRGLVGVVLEKPGATLGFLAFVTIVGSSRHKRVGDMLAGTVVLSERVPAAGAGEIAIKMPRPLVGWAASLDLTAVDDTLAMRARQLLLRAGQLAPTARDQLQRDLTAELVARVGPAPDGAPDWAVLSAVVAERGRRALAASTPPPPADRRVPPPPPTPTASTPTPTRADTERPEPSPPATSGGFAPPG
jgi:uncharacterized RDD family membrane protein YckC